MDHTYANTRAHHSGDHCLQSADARTGHVDGLAGVWKLAAGRALRIHAGQPGVLSIAHGRVWATFDDAGLDDRSRAGDHFLSRGESLPLLPGQTLVMESFGVGHTASAYFAWEPVPELLAVPHHAGASLKSRAVQPLADLRHAGALAARAVVSLAGTAASSVWQGGEALLTGLAMVFVASRNGCQSSVRVFKG